MIYKVLYHRDCEAVNPTRKYLVEADNKPTIFQVIEAFNLNVSKYDKIEVIPLHIKKI